MPEQITKYPDVTLQVLKGAGARCGEGVEQKILKQCPADRFCSLPTGEMCIYGISEIPKMTQIKPAELAPVVCPMKTSLYGADMGSLGFALAIAALIGVYWRRWFRH